MFLPRPPPFLFFLLPSAEKNAQCRKKGLSESRRERALDILRNKSSATACAALI